MTAFPKIVILLTIAAICTLVAFTGLSKLLDTPDNAPQYRPTTEITFEQESTSEGIGKRIERPVRAETKSRPPVIDDEITVISEFPFISSSKPSMPLVRFPPIMPKNAKKSGSCTFDLVINVRGKPKSVNNLKCTDSIFIKPTQIAVKKWVFPLKIEEGRAVVFSSLDQKITYELHDEDGNVIPE